MVILWNFISNSFGCDYGIFRKKSYGSEVTSYDYYGITLIIYSILTSGLTSANAFMEVSIRKPNMRIIYAPGSADVIYLSKIVSSFVFSFACHLFDMILLCAIYQIQMHAIAQIIILFGLAELFSNALGVMLCCVFKTEAMANQILGIVINLLAILGGLLFPLDGYGKIICGISYISPAKWLVKTSFAMIYDNDFSSFYSTIAISILVIAVAFIVCKKTFRKEDCIC